MVVVIVLAAQLTVVMYRRHGQDRRMWGWNGKYRLTITEASTWILGFWSLSQLTLVVSWPVEEITAISSDGSVISGWGSLSAVFVSWCCL